MTMALKSLADVLRGGIRGLGHVGLLCIPGLSGAGTIDTASQAPYEQCGYCHEYDGNSVMAQYPKLSALPPQYIAKQLKDFRVGQRDGKGMMQEAARLLSAAEIKAVADYFGDQKRSFPQTNSPTTSDQRPLGERLFERGRPESGVAACATCHRGQQPIPTLFGQHAAYLRAQLRAFKDGGRRNDAGAVMRRIAEAMSPKEIDAVSEYLAKNGAGQ